MSAVTNQQRALWANRVMRDCLLEAGDDVDAALSAAELFLKDNPEPHNLISDRNEPPKPVRHLTTNYPRDRANRFVDKYKIAEAARDHEKAVMLGKELPQEQLTNLDLAMYHLQSGGTVHHPKENPGLAIDKDGRIADERWQEYAIQSVRRGEWEDRDTKRNSHKTAVEDFTRAFRKVPKKPDNLSDHLKWAESEIKKLPATPSEIRSVERLRSKLERTSNESLSENLIDLIEEVIESIHKRIEDEEKEDPEISLPVEPTEEASLNNIMFGMVGNEWHGPRPPNWGKWSEIRPGPRGGRRWRHEGGVRAGQEESEAPVNSGEKLQSISARDFRRAEFIPPDYKGESIHAAAIGTVNLDGHKLFYKGVGKYSAQREMLVAKALSLAGVRTPQVRYANIPGAPVETETYGEEARGGILSEWIDGKTVLELETEDGLSFTEDIEPNLRPGELDRIALMTYLLRMDDRHEGNFMVEGDRLVSIDHENVLWGEQGSTPIEDEDLGYELMVNALCIRDSWDYKKNSRDPLDLNWSTPAEFNKDVLDEIAGKVDEIAALMRRYNPNIAAKVRHNGSVLKQMSREGNYSYERFRELNDELVIG